LNNKNNSNKKIGIRNVDFDLWNQVQEFAKIDESKIKAVKIIFEQHYQLPEKCINLIKKLADVGQPKEIRIEIAKKLNQNQNIPFGMHVDLILILQNDQETEVKKHLDKISKELKDLLFIGGLSKLRTFGEPIPSLKQFSFDHSFLDKITLGHTQKHSIEYEKDLLKIIKNKNTIILQELFPVEDLERLNSKFAESYGVSILDINTKILRHVCQFSHKYHTLNINGENFDKVLLHSFYFLGDFIVLIFICVLNLQDLKNSFSSVTEGSQKLKEQMEKIQLEIEKKLPNYLHGFFYNNRLNAHNNSTTNLPSLYVYDVREYSSFLGETDSSEHIPLNIMQTTRDRAENFVDQFSPSRTIPRENNGLYELGFNSNLLFGLINKSLIISMDEKFFQFSVGKLPSRFIVLCFKEFESFIEENSTVFNFITEFSYFFYLATLSEFLKVELENMVIPTASNLDDELTLNAEKLAIYQYGNALISVEDTYRMYKEGRKNAAEEGLNGFSEDEYYKDRIGKYYEVESITQYFNKKLDLNFDSIEKSIFQKRARNKGQLNFLKLKLQSNRDKPIINSFLRDIESELTPEIKHWDGKIPQKDIEQWLLNFENSEDKILALKILNKLSFVTYEELKMLCKALCNRMRSYHNINLQNCLFAPVGGITSGATHIIKLFQEENHLSEQVFYEVTQLKPSRKKQTLVLLDDFIGSGNAFCKFYKKHGLEQKIEEMDLEIYCGALTAFEKGITKIKEKTGIDVAFGNLLEQEQYQVRDGKVFTEKERPKIEDLITKYKSRLPKQYLWGYDDCQLLIAFQSNIPNNSISILWCKNGWSPLISRK